MSELEKGKAKNNGMSCLIENLDSKSKKRKTKSEKRKTKSDEMNVCIWHELFD